MYSERDKLINTLLIVTKSSYQYEKNGLNYLRKFIDKFEDKFEDKLAVYNPFDFTYKWIEDLTEIEYNLLNTSPIEPIKSIYSFERKYIKMDGYKYEQPDEYINGKTYYEYSETSYIRRNWRLIENTIKGYDKEYSNYLHLLDIFNKNQSSIIEYNK